MKLETVRDNLKRTIYGKEMLLETYENPSVGRHNAGSQMAMTATIEFLKVNIDELKKILADIELCTNDADANSWIENPDRMGGQFTQEEINNASKW